MPWYTGAHRPPERRNSIQARDPRTPRPKYRYYIECLGLLRPFLYLLKYSTSQPVLCLLAQQKQTTGFVLQVFLLVDETQNGPKPKSKQLKTYMLQKKAKVGGQKCSPLFPHSWRIQLSIFWMIAKSKGGSDLPPRFTDGSH